MLWRYAKARGDNTSVGENTNILGYHDFNQIHEYAIPALQWANEEGIVTGRTGNLLAPTGSATRAEAAAILQRYLA